MIFTQCWEAGAKQGDHWWKHMGCYTAKAEPSHSRHVNLFQIRFLDHHLKQLQHAAGMFNHSPLLV